MPMVRYHKHDQAGVDFAGEFIGPRRQPKVKKSHSRKVVHDPRGEFYD